MSNFPNPKPNYFDSVSVSIASPEEILSWSTGEVKKPETINYRTQKPEKDGLFCERIFGPTKNWECYCGKYKRIRYKGVICEKCGVEVTRSVVRRERMGHIKLAVPVTHIWFLRSTPSRVGLLLDLPIKTIEQVVYFAAYIITSVDEESKEEAKTQLAEQHKSHRKKIQEEFKEKNKVAKKAGVSEKDLEKIEKEHARRVEEIDEQHSVAKNDLNSIKLCKVFPELEYRDMSMKFGHIFKASTGAESIRDIISRINLAETIKLLEEDLKKSTGQKQKKIIKKIKLAGSLLKANIKAEWMIMTVLPVIPPDLRPMVQLDGGRFAASDLNDLYRRVINRNNRLKKLITIGAPEVICRNEKRMLQEAVDTLLNNNARQSRTGFNTGDKRKLRSLSDMLKGKQGRFRQNLLGKRVDYSGRSVIVVGPHLKLHQCGLPKQMALELFKPFVIGKLIKEGFAHNIKNAEKLIIVGKKEVWDILEEVSKDHYVLLNRAPTLHRLGIQAFQPVLVEGKAIKIHPLVCAAFNADFDGDQMAVHVPLSKPAQEEAKNIMSSARNLLKPSAGEPVITPSQDMILGAYYLTFIKTGATTSSQIFGSKEEAEIAYELKNIKLQDLIKIRHNGEMIETSVGRLIFNEIIPSELGYKNKTLTKKSLKDIFSECFEKCGIDKTAKLADDVKNIGFKYSTISGLSFAISDMTIPEEKEKIVNIASEIVKKINYAYAKGQVTDDERYLQTIKIWSRAKQDVSKAMVGSIKEENSIHYMITSGARGNWGQITQMCGMKGLVANPAGKTIELPIKSNLKEGFTILEYFIATHGGRKGKSDTALKTAEAGYLTRRLVDAVQDIIIREDDCGSKEGHLITVEESMGIGITFESRIFGRTLNKDVINEKTKEKIAKKADIIDKNIIDNIQNNDIEEVEVRSILTCQTAGGICKQCYGKDLGTNKLVETGTAVGIIAAQSIGEPGTQLTMRTFHMGGVAEGADITQGLTRVEELLEARSPKTPCILSEIAGEVKIIKQSHSMDITVTSIEPALKDYVFAKNYKIEVTKGDKVKEKQVLAKSTKAKNMIKCEEGGTVEKIENGKVTIKIESGVTKSYSVALKQLLKVKDGASVKMGSPITAGHIDLKELLKLKGIYAVQKYIVNEVQSIYASQGQTINDKHIEIIARQMLSKIRILDSGDSKFLPGEISDCINLEKINKDLGSDKKDKAHGERLLLGLTRIALHTSSWLSAASFQETIRVLVEAATTKKVDPLKGLKENVIIGKLIPAGKIYQKQLAEEKIEEENKRQAKK